MNSQSGDQTRRSTARPEALRPSLGEGPARQARPANPGAAPLQPSLGGNAARPARPARPASPAPSSGVNRAAAPRPAAQGARTDRRAAERAPSRSASTPARPNGASAGAAPRRPVQKPASRESAAPKSRPAPRRKKPGFGRAFARFFARLTKPLDVFRRDEASTIVVNSLVGALALVVVLALLTLAGPGMRMARARMLASSGQAEAADKLLDALEEAGYSAREVEQTRFSLVESLIRRERFDEALAYAAALEGNGAEALILRARYGQAAAQYDAGEYAAAAQAFYQLGDYEDSASRYDDARCALAVATFLGGDEGAARQLLLNIEDVDQRVAAAALKVTGSQTQAQALLSLELFNPDSLAELERTMAQLSAARAGTPTGRVAAGRRHTAGLRADGAVLAAGDNSFGQCDVGGWSGVIQIAAGAYHTVGLRMDGTVLAAGDNSEGQCDVSGWTNITAVAATAYGTLGLKDDGTVMMCGLHSDAVSGWHGVTRIAGGSYSAACLYGQGGMLCTHRGAQLDMGVALYDLSVCGPVAAGVSPDGSLVCSYEKAPDWTGLVSVTVSETGLLGVTSDGLARRFVYHTGEDTVVPVDGTAVEAESSGTHDVVLTSDGRVFAFGLNDAGQCDVSGWRL